MKAPPPPKLGRSRHGRLCPNPAEEACPGTVPAWLRRKRQASRTVRKGSSRRFSMLPRPFQTVRILALCPPISVPPPSLSSPSPVNFFWEKQRSIRLDQNIVRKAFSSRFRRTFSRLGGWRGWTSEWEEVPGKVARRWVTDASSRPALGSVGSLHLRPL